MYYCSWNILAEVGGKDEDSQSVRVSCNIGQMCQGVVAMRSVNWQPLPQECCVAVSTLLHVHVSCTYVITITAHLLPCIQA